jgi:chromosome segregation ATPase
MTTPPSAPPIERLTAAVQRLESALEARVQSESGLRGELAQAAKRAQTAEAALAQLQAEYDALAGLADEVEARLDKAIDKLKAATV